MVQPFKYTIFKKGKYLYISSFFLEKYSLYTQTLEYILSVEEKERANKFYFEKDKKNFVISKSAQRQILSIFLGIEPKKIEFSYGLHGKPVLSQKYKKYQIYFNISHSHKLAVYAITRNRQIGIDIEWIRQIQNFEQISRQFFSKQENIEFSGLAQNQKLNGKRVI